MAILVYDGFDHYSSLTDLQARAGALEWSDIALSEFSTLGFDTGRGGYGRCVLLGGGSLGGYRLGGSFSVNLAAGFIGGAVLASPGMEYVDFHLMQYPAQTQAITARVFCNSGVVSIYNGDPAVVTTPVASTPPNAINPYIWTYFEIGFSPSGSIDVHVNGNTIGPCNAGVPGATYNGVRIAGTVLNALGAELRIDDLYVCDNTTGPGTFPCNSFLGDTAVRTLYPTANSSVAWTPLAGTNFSEVNEAQFDGDTTYNSATTVGASDTFTFGPLPTTVSAVYAVQVTGAYRKGDASAQTIVQKVVSGGTTGASSAFPIALGYSYETTLFPVDPHTGGTWTPAAVNAVIAGYELAS